MDYEKLLVDPQAAALWRAIALRRLNGYRAAIESAKQHGDDLAGLMEPPKYAQIEAAYTHLIEEYIDQSIDNLNVARCAVDLMAAITQDLEFRYVFEHGGVVSEEKDRAD